MNTVKISIKTQSKLFDLHLGNADDIKDNADDVKKNIKDINKDVKGNWIRWLKYLQGKNLISTIILCL